MQRPALRVCKARLALQQAIKLQFPLLADAWQARCLKESANTEKKIINMNANNNSNNNSAKLMWQQTKRTTRVYVLSCRAALRWHSKLQEALKRRCERCAVVNAKIYERSCVRVCVRLPPTCRHHYPCAAYAARFNNNVTYQLAFLFFVVLTSLRIFFWPFYVLLRFPLQP